ncbi:MAG: hypothetical protein CMI53_04480 [Parcubacteria group bacterium]|nr:hypothetical protein [Parcubacteria group bacterium]
MVGDVLIFYRSIIGKEFDGDILLTKSTKKTSWEVLFHQKVHWILGFQAGEGRMGGKIELEELRIEVAELISLENEILFTTSQVAFCELMEWVSDHDEISWSIAA